MPRVLDRSTDPIIGSVPGTWMVDPVGVDIHLGFGAGNIVVADTIDITIDVEFTSEGAEQT